MLTITPIKNVQSTINNISFKSGVISNYGSDAVNNSPDSKYDNSFMANFLGTIKESPFYTKLFARQEAIEKSLNAEQNKFNAVA